MEEVKCGVVKSGKRMLAVLLGAVMLAGTVSGCGREADGTTGGSSSSAPGDSSRNSEENGQSWPADTPLGRYVEETVEMPEGFTLTSSNYRFHKLADGSLILTEGNGGILISKDYGKSWKEEQRQWYTRLKEEKDIMSIAIGSDDTVAVIWTDPLEEDALENAAAIKLDTKLLIVKPDGTEIAIEPVLEEDDYWINNVYISETGKIIAGTIGPNLYEVTEDGRLELYLTIEEGRPELISFHQQLMLLDGWGYQEPLLYDMESDRYTDDDVLADYVAENYSGRDSYAGDFYDMFLVSGGEDILYIAGDKGLYRHVLGGSAMEQVVDGSLSSFSNPSYSIADMAVLENNEFLVVFNNGKVVRYVYNPDIPTVPAGRLKVYSLEEKPTVRQAVSLHQVAHPEVYVEYEIGMGDGSSVTREDALKKLNTQIMAGEGPDVLILDHLPLDSYMEKGLLMDLSPLLNEMSAEDGIFDSVKNAFLTDGHIYTVPCELQLPFILGRSKVVAQMKDLEGIAGTVEQMRTSNPGVDLMEIASAKGIMKMFSMVSAPAWRTENGEINGEAIADFLSQTKRIYDAQMDGLSEKAIEDWQETSDSYMEAVGKPIEDTDYIRMYEGELNFMGGLRKFAMGSLGEWYQYARQVSVCTSKGFEDCEIIPMSGQCGNVFWARTMLGISAASANTALAEDFLRTALGRENQMSLLGGMAVTKEGLLADLEARKSRHQDDSFGINTLSNADGLYVYLEVRIPEDDEVESLIAWIESADTAYIEDVTMENAVYEEGAAYMQGEKSLESAVEEIEKKLAIYLAE